MSNLLWCLTWNNFYRQDSNSLIFFFVKEDDIETPFGNLHVAIQGDRSKLAILTFHDIGLNSKSMHGNICLLIVTNQINLSSKFNWLFDYTNAIVKFYFLLFIMKWNTEFCILGLNLNLQFDIEMLLLNNF